MNDGIVSSITAMIFAWIFGGDDCYEFNIDKYANIAQVYIDSSRKSSVGNLFLGRWPRAVVEKSAIRPTGANDQSDGAIAVVPIDVGAGKVDLVIWPNCTFYPMPLR